MTQYNNLNVKLSNSQFNKLKLRIKNGTGVTLNLSSNMIGNSNDETNFPNKLLLTNREVWRFCKTFAKNLSINKRLSKTQLSRMVQSGEFLGRILGPLLKTGSPLMKNILKRLAKSVLLLLELTAAADTAADVGIHKKIWGLGMTTLITSNKVVYDIIKIVKSNSETNKNEAKEQKAGFFIMLLPSKHLLVLKTSSRSLQDMPWRRLEDISWRCLEDMS